MASIQERASRLELVGFDVDGTLTDGGLYFGPEGEALKRFSVFDGHGLRSLIQSGIRVAWITARQSDIVSQRARDLGIEFVVQGCRTKLQAMDGIRQSLGLTWEQCGFFGDDWPDYPVLKTVGFAATTHTAHPRIQAVAHFMPQRAAGHGAARELCDFITEHHPRGVKPWLD